MNIALIKRMMDACYQAKRVRDLLPALPDGVLPSFIQYLDAIQTLEQQGVQVKVSDLSDALSLPRPGVTRTVKDMEARGLLTKQTSPEDGRVTYLTITEAGRALSRKYDAEYFSSLVPALEVIPEEDAFRLNTVLLSAERKKRFEEDMDINFALEIGADRFRVCLMMHKDGSAASYRLVPDHICSLEELGFLDHDVTHIKRLLDYHNGLVLVTGPIGSGKTTTLAAMVDIINEKRTDHIITVEDPIEILQNSKNCQVTQREIGKHTISYRTALKAALREDPDVIVIGELHDLETIENAITASETGHLVIGTLHTSDAANTLNRLLDVFPPSQQPQIRAMTAGSLRGIICQRLIPAADGGLTTAYEILINNMAVGNIISEGKAFKLKSTMQIGNKQGMCTLDQCLLEKYKAGLITYEVAKYYMHDQAETAQLEREYAIRQAQQLQAN